MTNGKHTHVRLKTSDYYLLGSLNFQHWQFKEVICNNTQQKQYKVARNNTSSGSFPEKLNGLGEEISDPVTDKSYYMRLQTAPNNYPHL